MSTTLRVPLLGAVLLLLAAALVAALVPGGVALDRRVTAEIRRTAVEDLGRAPMILDDRNAARAEALSMHAMSVAAAEGLAAALSGGRLGEAERIVTEAAGAYGEEAVLVAPDGRPVAGPAVPAAILEPVRRGEGRVAYVFQGGMPRAVALVPLAEPAGWVAGSAAAMGQDQVNTLAALARADVTVLGADGRVVASTLSADSAAATAAAALSDEGRAETEKVREVQVAGDAVWVARSALDEAGTVIFSRPVSEELAALPGVRRSALVAGLLTMVLALGVGSLVAMTLTRPVRGLAAAADRVTGGDFEAPVPSSRIEELDRLAVAFRSMRARLRDRIQELGILNRDLATANEELEERQRRLAELQAELIRRDRLASSARMAAELAHEIRNPVANVRNCLEVVRRGLEPGSDVERFADLAIDELLRMHELAEQLLDLNRPADPARGSCRPAEVARQVASLAAVGQPTARVEVHGFDGDGDAGSAVDVPPDALKQILFNLVENAREATAGGEPVRIELSKEGALTRIDVVDEGPGIPDDVLPHIFDPFFTTKDAVTGVGLGLFVAEGLVRRYGGRMEAENVEGGGARFRVELPSSADT